MFLNNFFVILWKNYEKMKASSSLLTQTSLAALVMLAACGQKHAGSDGGFPKDFDVRDDISKMAYVMENASPDSVARFLCDASLGRVKGARIDTLAIAAAYAYEHYADSALMEFSSEFDSYSAALPLPDKMKIYSMVGTSDPQRLGYELGLEYVSSIRDQRKSVDDIRRELEAFRVACENDTDTYVRFIKGFKTVLKVDRGKDLPEAVYNAFIDY